MKHFLRKRWTRSAIPVGLPAESAEDDQRIHVGANGYDDMEHYERVKG
jgi:hypothetical protein